MMLLKNIKVPIAMRQSVSLCDAKRSNQAINLLAHLDPFRSQRPKVFGRRKRYLRFIRISGECVRLKLWDKAVGRGMWQDGRPVAKKRGTYKPGSR
jgi:hypothetical protein